MLKKLIPIILLLVGSSAGVGAGIFLRPAPKVLEEGADDHESAAQEHAVQDSEHEGDDGHGLKGKDSHVTNAQASDEDHSDEPKEMEYVKLNNQFVVPIVKDQNVASLVVLSLSVEVPTGQKDGVYQREPKIRDSFLRVLFDHANIGGFDGAFTDAIMLGGLRTSLREVAQRDLGSDVVNDVLILEIARQDY